MELREIEMTSENNLTGSTYNCSLEEISVSCDMKMYLDYTVLVLIGINVIGIGGHVDGDRMVILLTRPFLVTVAMILRFVLLPAIGLGCIELFRLTPVTGMSLLATIVAPHEGISCLLLLLLDADLTVSMAIVGANNFSTSAFLPLWAMVYEYYFYGSPGVIKLPMREIFIVFGYLCGAGSLGLLIRKKCDKCYDKYWEYLPSFTILTIAFIIATQVLMHLPTFQFINLTVIAVGVVISISGFLIGALTGYILRQPLDISSVLCVETGVRTTYITSILTAVSFIDTQQNSANIVPFLVSIMSVVPLYITVLVVRTLRTKSMFKKYFKEQDIDRAVLEEPLCSVKDNSVA